jgi:hypothetical protein
MSSVAFIGAAGLALAVALGFVPVKPWLYLAGGLGVLGFVASPSMPATPGA